ncbi:hypothetical protein C1H76_1581 [Elsinoe australis]|uniref:Uncharacterized protein n=1 Tax=Elsinoe australis TaxID=40998 RepID=A0A2P7Z623_9PEZI|nr:hypothetical protein B9Z65_7180 [Elsinoe australis]TKX26228.1 hypothetical protein C1H76_1581 [Elsinoe australis]
MSGLFRPRNLAIAAGGGLAAFYIFPKTSAAKINPLNTTGTQNIEERWSAGGGSGKHTPGVATPRGASPDSRNAELTGNDQIKPKGLPYNHYKDNISDQKVDVAKPNKLTEKWWETHHGNEKGK